MKLSTREAPGYFAKPDPGKAGVLIYGQDTMRIAHYRQELIRALIGPEGEEEMRLTRIPAAELRKDPAQATDAVKAVSFFPGPRVVFIEEATDQAAQAILAALEDWREGDAQIVVTAGALKPTSQIRKAFEAHPEAYATGIYDDPMSRPEIERALAQAGVTAPGRDEMAALIDLAQSIDPGDFRQVLDKISLYKLGDETPLTLDDIAVCAPASTEADVTDILHIVAEGRAAEIGPMLARLQAQGANAVSLLIAAMRHFRNLHKAAADPSGPAQGIGRLRPPVHFKQRDRMVRQAQGWGVSELEDAVSLLLDTDLSLRSAGQTAPQMALVERSFIRLAMKRARRV